MATLIMDIGNTRAKAAVFEQGEVLESVASTKVEKLGIDHLCQHHNIEASIASVVGKKVDFQSLLPPGLYRNLHLLNSSSRLPITINYDTPQTLGMDRVAAVVGARELCHSGALVVVDAGSCITVDLLDCDNVYQGGAILPGLSMRFKALHSQTASLPLVEPSSEEWLGDIITPISGHSTRTSIMSGVMNASVFEIEGFIRHYQQKYTDIKLFLTGGDAVFFAKQLFFPNFAMPNLVYLGLDKILKMNL